MDERKGFENVFSGCREEKEQYHLKMLTREELAAKWKVCVHTIDNYRRKLGLPYVKIGASVRFSLYDVAMWLRNRELEYLIERGCSKSDF